MVREPPPPVPTLGEIRHSTPWLWLNCPARRHYHPIALAPLIIRWGRTYRATYYAAQPAAHAVATKAPYLRIRAGPV
jgi:hypothetical protein